MTYGIRRREGFGGGLRRLIAEDLAAAGRELTQGKETEGRRIHKARRRLKRARTALAALRPRLGGEGDRLAGEIAELAHRLGPLRDAEVLRSTLASLKRRRRPRASLSAAAGAEAALTAGGPPEVARLIARAARDAAALPTPAEGPDLLEQALRRAYRRGRRAYEAALESREPDDLHRWRKRVKDLWHLVLLARLHLPRRSAKFARRLDRLAEWIGADHDLVLASDSINAQAGEAARHYAPLIAAERAALQDKAFRLGAKLYRRRTGAFARRYIKLS